MKNPLIIGITGGIGSGKTTMSNQLRAEGFYVYNSDLEARRLQNENQEIRQMMISIFGSNIYNSEGLDRRALAKIVFENRDLLSKLNEIVHPILRADFNDWVLLHQSEKILFIESAIMLETGLSKLVDKVVLMTASEKIRIERVIKRDALSIDDVKARMSNQLSEEAKIKLADIIIHTDDNLPMQNKMQQLLASIQ